MSQFPAQIAISPQGQAARRNLPVDLPVGTGVSVVQPAAGAAPDIPGVAALPAPVPDFSAARDLEQALRATNALGSTLIQTGNALNIQNQIDSRRSIYQARAAADKTISQQTLDFQAGKMNNAIDATDDMDGFAAYGADGWLDPSRQGPRAPEEPMTEAERVYADLVVDARRKMYIGRRSKLQEEMFADDVRGVYHEMLDENFVGPMQNADERWAEFSARYPWLNRGQMMNAVYVASLKSAAEAGDRETFERISSGITSDQERTLYVDDIRPTLDAASAAKTRRSIEFLSTAMKEFKETSAPAVQKMTRLEERFEEFGIPEGMREPARIEVLLEEMKLAGSRERLSAIDMIARSSLSEEGQRAYESGKAAQMRPVITEWMKGLAANGSPEYLREREESGSMVAADDLATMDATFDRRFNERRAEAVVLAYQRQDNRVEMVREMLPLLATGWASVGDVSRVLREYEPPKTRAEIVKELDDALNRYDPSKPDLLQVETSIRPSQYSDIIAKLDRVDAMRADQTLATDVMSGRLRIGDANDSRWAKVLEATGVMSGSRIRDPAALAGIVDLNRSFPAPAMKAMYSGLQAPTAEERMAALELLFAVAPLIDDQDAASRISGMPMEVARSIASEATLQAVEAMVPMLAKMERGPDNRMSPSQRQAVLERWETALSQTAGSTRPDVDEQRLTDLAIANRIMQFQGYDAYDRTTNLPSGKQLLAAVKNAAVEKFQESGFPQEAAIDLADRATATFARRVRPAIGNMGFSLESLNEQFDAIMAETPNDFHVATVGGRAFRSMTERVMAPQAQWDEARFAQAIERAGFRMEDVADVSAKFGEGNAWFVTRRDPETGTFLAPVIIDLGTMPVAPDDGQEQPANIDDRIEASLDAGRRKKRGSAHWSQNYNP